MSDTKIVVIGAAGRMGRELLKATHATDGCAIHGGTEVAGSPALGTDLGTLAGLEPVGVSAVENLEPLLVDADAVIDFTVPAATVATAKLASATKTVHVIGTTGMSDTQQAEINVAATEIPIIQAGNMSLGVNLLTAVTRRIAAALDADFDIEIVEMHHKHKVDAPSGTALMLGQAAAEGRDVNLRETSVRTRDGHTGPRNRGDIGFATLRGGSVVGDHTVIFAGEGERIEVTHRAGDRSIFARGAVKAAVWGRAKEPGLYSMTDVLGL